MGTVLVEDRPLSYVGVSGKRSETPSNILSYELTIPTLFNERRPWASFFMH